MALVRTRTSDSSAGARVIHIAGRTPENIPISIFLRHNTALRWCGAGGDWLADRRHAVRFATSVDALVYCQALNVRGLLVAFDQGGREVYQLNMDKILDAMAENPRVRSVFHSRQQDFPRQFGYS